VEPNEDPAETIKKLRKKPRPAVEKLGEFRLLATPINHLRISSSRFGTPPTQDADEDMETILQELGKLDVNQ